jgi:hypothetical protein
MKLVLLALAAFSSSLLANTPVKVADFQLTDQKGSDQLTPWIQSIKERYGTRVDIDGIADMSSVPGFLQNRVRKAFREKMSYSVMLDWEGDVVKQFAYAKGVANIYLIDRNGHIVRRTSGPKTDAGLQGLFTELDRLVSEAEKK